MLIQTIQFQCQKLFHFKQSSLAWVHSLIVKNISISSYSAQLNSSNSNNSVSMSKTVSFQTIQFRISTQFSSIWPIDRTLSSATTPGQSGPGSNGNEGVLRIPQISSITGTSPSDGLMSYPGHSLGEFYPSAEKQSVYSTTPSDWASSLA